MKIPKIKNLFLALVILTCGFMITACSTEKSTSTDDFEKQVEDYLRKFPYQETYRYAMLQTGGDPAKLNIWVNSPRGLLKAGEDKVVRSNNDTVYRMAWVYLGEGPVVLQSAAPSKERFSSFQLQDDRNANYRNIIHPAGSYTLYYGEKPANIVGEAVEVPSLLSAVITRIEVKDKNDPADLADALSVYDGLTIEGPAISQFPVVDVLSEFDERVVQEADKHMQETKKTVPYSEMIAGPGQEPGKDISYLNFATGTKEGWGGPATSHSAYESWYNDESGEILDGSKGEYMLVTEAPPVNAFWSVTVYDSTTGRFHPNDDDRYHINNTTAVKNADGTYTFRFKVKCEEGDVNCLEVPAGPFDVAVRYYLPEQEIMSGEWTMPKPVLQKFNFTPDVARNLATEAWLFGLPLVMFEKQVDYSTHVTQAEETRAPINQFVHYRKFVDASNRSIVGFNVDNLYSLAWIDLAAEPLVLAVPAMGDRYWMMQIVDAWNGVPAVPGSRTHSGDDPHVFLVAGPDWKGTVPEGMELLRSPTNLGGIGGRTYCAGADDYATVNALQDQYKLTPLSAWGKPDMPPANVPLKKGVDGKTLVNERVMALDAGQFFSNLNRLMATNPPYAEDAPMLEKLRPLGIAPGAPFSTEGLGADVVAALEEGVAQGKAAMAAEMKILGKMVNNWGLTYDMGRYGTKYAYRAAWTFVGIGGNMIEDAFYPLALNDADGQPLSAEHRYTLTFPEGAWPPADAFWSMTLYDIEGYLVDNPLDRYAIGDRSGMEPNPDGSLTIYIQSESPGKDKEANWLPAPKTGPFKLALRLYVPQKSVLDEDWVPPAIQRVDSEQMLSAFGLTPLNNKKLLRHVVLVKFKEDLTESQVQEVVDAFTALPGKVESILDIEYGTNISMENKSAGFTHGFVITFADQKGLDDTLPHPAHLEFAKLARARVDDMLMFDYFANDDPLTATEAKAIAKETFFWGMHPVGIYHLRYNFAQNELNPRAAGINRLSWFRTPMKALPRVATTPNATTLYGVGMFDLSKEPAVITVPEIKDHYWSVQLHDNYARWWHLIGSQFNAPGLVRRLLLGPNWSGDLPDGFVGADIVQSTSDFVGILARVALTDDTEKEVQIVNGIQDGITAMSLSQWIAAGRKYVRAEDVPLTKADYPTYPGMETVTEPGSLKGVDFLRWVSLVLNDPSFTKQTDSYHEVTAFKRFERLGLKVGSPFDPDQLTPEIAAAVEAGIEEGKEEVVALMFESPASDRNGWIYDTDVGYEDNNWRQRAFYGLKGVLGPVPAQSHTAANCLKDPQGRPLSGEHRYTITFDLDDMPPVTEFWEMPLYDTEGYFYDNPLDRYSLNSYMLDRGKLHTEDGKLVIYVQHDEPKDPKQRQNWLPVPQDDFRFTARFYGPYTPLIDGSYNMPGVVRVD